MTRLITKSVFVSLLILIIYKNRFRLVNLLVLLFTVQKGFQGSKWLSFIDRVFDVNVLKILKEQMDKASESL